MTQLYSRPVAEAHVEPWEELTRRVVKVCNNFEKMKDDVAEFAKEEAAAEEEDEEEDDEEDWEVEEIEEDEVLEEEEDGQEEQEEILTLKRKRPQDPRVQALNNLLVCLYFILKTSDFVFRSH